jgi:hypothetical protein
VTWLLAYAMALTELKKPSFVLTPAQLMYWHDKTELIEIQILDSAGN